MIQKATQPQDILILAKDNLAELNHIHVNAVFNRLGKMAKSRDFSPQRLATDETFQELLRLVRDFSKSGNYEAQNVSNITHGIAKLHEAGRLDGLDGGVDEVLAALEREAGRVAPDMDPQAVANTVWGYAKLGRMPGEDTWAALEGAAGRVAPDMDPQNVANTVWGYATFSILNGIQFPTSFAPMWDRACGLNSGSFTRSDESLLMLFHTHLMIESLDFCQFVKVAHPEWLKEARDAWMRQTENDTTISRAHRDLAKVFDELGVTHEVERLTDDGYFSMDIYLPEHDVCVEFDGPTHYYNTDDEDLSNTSALPRDISMMRRTTKTELRDFFLAKRCSKVVVVPWFEFAQVKTSLRRQYVREKLLDAGLECP